MPFEPPPEYSLALDQRVRQYRNGKTNGTWINREQYQPAPYKPKSNQWMPYQPPSYHSASNSTHQPPTGELARYQDQNNMYNPMYQLQQYADQMLSHGGALTIRPVTEGPGFTVSVARTCYICGEDCKLQYWSCRKCVLQICKACFKSGRGCDKKKNHTLEEV
ncbi:hypothetical protein BT63DRAFT_421809 [Microthyrium microscopicum]|uniref:Uncharacterized protein n=1 Tax=Microthyrium microscopicum TaxID=703497 RepID=A0A6A6URX1_9PEZI|nr:hypothetical protein BT63DRAFT_421809 [Microthyrium microscopicum]